MATANELERREAPAAPPPPRAGTPLLPAVALTGGAALAVLVLADLLTGVITIEGLEVVAAVLGAALAVAAVPRRAAPWVAAALIGAWPLAQLVYFLARRIYLPLPVDRAVGGATLSGTSYLAAQYASVLLLGAALVGGIVVRRRLGAAKPLAPAASAPAPRAPLYRRPAVQIAVITAVLAFALLPDALGRLQALVVGNVPPGWDSGNLLTWDALLERGLVPVKDFFYPYGHVIAFEATPWGPVWQWLSHVLLLAIGAWSFWRLSGGHVIRTALAVLVLAMLLNTSVLFDRYMPGLLIGVAYAALGPCRHTRFTLGHAIVAVAVLYTTWLEPDVLLIGIAGAGCVLLGELIAGRVALDRSLPKRLAIDVAPLAVVVLVPLQWALEGTFDENRRLWLGLRSLSVIAGPDEKLAGAFYQPTFKPTFLMVVTALPLLMAITGLALGRVRDRGTHAASMLMLAGAGAAELLLLKHLVRPAQAYVILPALLVVPWAAIVIWNARALRVAAVAGACAGATFVAFQQQLIASTFFSNAYHSPANLVKDARLHWRYAAVSAAEHQRFDRSRYADWPETAVADELKQVMASSPNKTFAVLGDAPLLYVLLDQAPPYHIELYNSGRIEEQRAYIADLERRHTQFLVNRPALGIDGVPQPTRNPLVYDYVIRNFVPVRETPFFDYLARRGSKPIAADYWRKRLGPQALGYIPAASKAAGADHCTGGSGCARYALVQGHATHAGQVVRLRVSGPDGKAYSAELLAKPGKDTYPVRLDRLWFSPIVGPNPRVEVQEPGGWKVSVEGRKTGDALY